MEITYCYHCLISFCRPAGCRGNERRVVVRKRSYVIEEINPAWSQNRYPTLSHLTSISDQLTSVLTLPRLAPPILFDHFSPTGITETPILRIFCVRMPLSFSW